MCSRKRFYRHHGYHPKFHWKGHHGHGAPWKKHWHFSNWGSYPPVNIEELDDHYELSLYASGLDKSDFKVIVKNNILIIKADEQQSDIVEELNWRRREFKAGGFRRAFELNEKVDKENISAEYKEGVLKVTLPKLPGFETTRQEVTVN